jgi:acyl-CoA thioester hydrolase
MLTAEVEIPIRFSETDAMGVVWHGNYLKFFEDGREAFGEKYGLKYLDIFDNGFFTPIVKSEVNHKAPVYYGQKVNVLTRFIPSKAAKMIFEYEVVNVTTGEICATGKTVQVFLTADKRELELSMPPFYKDWITQHQIL